MTNHDHITFDANEEAAENNANGGVVSVTNAANDNDAGELGMGRKKYKRSKKNRNVRRVLSTVKNKIETIQEQYGGAANFLLLLEDNFSDVSSAHMVVEKQQ